MFGLRRMDVFSTGDLGIQRGMAAFAGKNVKTLKASGKGKWKYMNEKDMLELSEKFRPYRSVYTLPLGRKKGCGLTTGLLIHSAVLLVYVEMRGNRWVQHHHPSSVYVQGLIV